jgi:Spy/CpxP family protein refolding chaperone
MGRGLGLGGGRMGDFTAPAIERRNLDRYSEMLALTEEQQEAARALVEGYEQQLRSQREAIRAKTEELRDRARETGDFTAFGEMRGIMEKARDERRTADAALISDLKSLLTPEQLEQWPRVERAQRRDSTLRRGFLSGERVNLFELVDRAALAPEERQPVDAVLSEYEMDLDRALIGRNAAYEEAFSQFGRMFGPGAENNDPERAQALMDKGREAASKVREVHKRYARQVQDLLPEAKRPAFEAAVLRESFPEVYRPTQAQRSLEAAMKLADLTAEQQDTIRSLSETYSRSLSQANQKMASLIQTQEEQATIQNMMARFQGGGDDPLRDIRRERRELGDATMENLRKVLTPEQAARLPEGEQDGRERGGRMGPGGEGVGEGQAPRRRARPVQDPT